MGLPDPSESFYGRIAVTRSARSPLHSPHLSPVMDPRRLSVTPGSGGSGNGGNGGHSVYTTSRRRRRMASPSTGTRLMPEFNAAVDGGASRSSSSSSSSSGGLDLGLEESHLLHSRHHAYPEASPTSNHVPRLLVLNSPMRPPPTDDDVLIMDGVLVDNNGSNTDSSNRRSVSFSDPSFVSAGSPGSSGGGRCGSNGQFSQGREEPRGMQAMRPRFSEVGSPSSRSVQGAAGSSNMLGQGSPITQPLRPPTLPGPNLPTPAPRGASAAVTIRPPAPYFTPPRVSIPVAKPGPSEPKQPETQPMLPAAATTFTWPPTAEEEASIIQKLYGPSTSGRPRLPVFVALCPAK